MTIMAWADLKTTDFRSLDRDATVAVLPLGAIEQHGPHLPISTDSLILAGLLERLRANRLDRGRALVLPLMPVGLSTEHTSFPGTLTVGASHLLASWSDLGRSVARAGIRRLVFLNSHGGNTALLDVVSRELRHELGMLVVAVTTHRFDLPLDAVPDDEARFGIHGGAVETALVQAFAPHLVDRDALAAFPSNEAAIVERNPDLGTCAGPARIAWMAEDLNRNGAVGDTLLASPELGERLVADLVTRLVRVLDDVLALPLPPTVSR
ncbi:MAG: creatininase family protein [Pseudomonadota bacterium]